MIFKLKEILSKHKIIVLTGGVSKGKFDFVPEVLAELGVKTIFHQVNHRPGKPLLFGGGPENQFIFGLPGNPVSCITTLRKYVIPVLTENYKPTLFAKISSEIILNKNMTFFLPAKLEFSSDGKVKAAPLKGNGSGDFYSLRDSDGFLEVDNSSCMNNFCTGTVLPFYHWNY
jgi:molybdopterin molybdotransferase